MRISKKDASTALAALTTTITEELKAGEKIAIPNLGTFEVRERAARTGHNPQTGETVEMRPLFWYPPSLAPLPQTTGMPILRSTRL